jgi:SAM-dependent methyltransferase
MMFGLKEDFEYNECGNCHAIQIANIPTDMQRHYPETYYSLDQTPEAAYQHPLRAYLERARTKYAVFGRGIIGRLMFNRYPDGAPMSLSLVEHMSYTSKILDVGCGSGNLLYALREIGFTQTFGTDPYLPKPITYPNGLTIETKKLPELDDTYDIIMMHHVFEHIDDPLQILCDIKTKLSINGTCIIRIPVADCAAWRIYGKHWVQLDPPRHFFLHTLQSMDILATKAGLVIDEVVFDSRDFQFWGSEQYQRDIPLMDERSLAVNPKSDIFTNAERNTWRRKARELNDDANGDQACFYLRHTT